MLGWALWKKNRSVQKNLHTWWHQAFELWTYHGPFTRFISICIAPGARLQSHRQCPFPDKSPLKECKAYSSLYKRKYQLSLSLVLSKIRSIEMRRGHGFLTGLTGHEIFFAGRHHLPQLSGARSPKKGPSIQRFQRETDGMLSDIFRHEPVWWWCRIDVSENWIQVLQFVVGGRVVDGIRIWAMLWCYWDSCHIPIQAFMSKNG